MLRFKDHIKKMQAYKPPLEGRGAKDYLLLDFNERTVPPSPKVKEALKKFIDSDKLQVYPEYGNLEEKIAQYARVPSNRVMVTNGGDQGIDIICRAHLSEGDKAIIPFPAFAMHYQSAGVQGAEISEPAYNKEDGSFPLRETLDLISNDEKISLAILCNPNNPLGTAIPLQDVEKILQKAQEPRTRAKLGAGLVQNRNEVSGSGKEIAVLHDEAYFEFSGITAKGLIEKYDNLYIVRTFSKAFGLVASRIGYVISQEKNLRELLKIRGPYDVNMFAKTAVLVALEDISCINEYVREVMEEAKPKLEKFFKEKGIAFFPSSANFLFLKVANPQVVIGKLKENGILVRPKKGPDNKEGIRVSIGTLQDTERLIDVFTKIL